MSENNLNEKIIEEVRKYPFLFDLSTTDYRNVIKKDKTWKTIGAALNINDEVCKKRWKSLRDSYKRYIRSESLATGSAAPVPGKKFKYADTMSFLNSVKDCRPTVGTTMEEGDDNAVFQDVIVECSSDIPESYLCMDDSSWENSMSTSTPIGKPSKKRDDAQLQATYTEMMAKCYGKLDEVVSAAPAAAKTPTLQLFDTLANKITSVGLSEDDIDAIEERVISVVYGEIANRRKRNQ